MQQVGTKTYTVFDALELALNKKLSFASYRLPGSRQVTLVLQKDHKLQNFQTLTDLPEKGGFLIAPFSNENSDKTYVIRPDIIIKDVLSGSQFQEISEIEASYVNGVTHIGPFESPKKAYLKQLNETIRLIKNKEYDKVVLSRVKLLNGKHIPNLNKIFQLLCKSYPNAFVYVFNFKGQCWVGATPEPLLCSNKDELHTVSLASTRPYSEENTKIDSWNHKELMEQEYVTQYIESVLSEYKIKDYSKIGPYTKRAGELLHLRTDFSFPSSNIHSKLPALINALHPTSAVCGIPMKKSLKFIKGIEVHNREYYAGYLGPVGIDDRLQLFVNLRCMKVLENHVALYVGGGITEESVAIDEWEETEIKAKTILSIMEQV